MEITKVKGIIISENAYSETSKLLNIFTEEYGIISVIAKGAKSIKSPIRSVTTKLTYAIFQIYYKKGKLSTLICADVINPFTEKDIFKLLEETLLKIEDGYDPIIITNILELKYLDYLGIKPVLDSCAVCGRPSAITVSTSKGGFVCANCHTNEKIVDKKTINVLRKLYHVDISKISKIKLSNNTRKEIDDFINEYYDRYSGLYLKSKNFLKSIKNVYI